jgi:hypothetical protein
MPPATPTCRNTPSENLIWLAAMLHNGTFLTSDAPGSQLSAAADQMRACLLVHLGLTPHDAKSANKAAVLAFVYDLRHYGYDCSFGPYMSDSSGHINWIHVHAIHRCDHHAPR